MFAPIYIKEIKQHKLTNKRYKLNKMLKIFLLFQLVIFSINANQKKPKVSKEKIKLYNRLIH